MEELLNEIDELLARFEDFTHEKDGEDITKMRGKIALALRQYNVSGQVCDHPYEYLSFGEDSYCECEKCNTRLS
jgi:hypothetical protein